MLGRTVGKVYVRMGRWGVLWGSWSGFRGNLRVNWIFGGYVR